jgi:hypothetical protein
MSEIEIDYEAVQKEVAVKVNQAIELLREARDLANAKRAWSAFQENLYPDLREVVSEFLDLDSGWDYSGCSS